MANGAKWLCRSDAEQLEKLLPKPFGMGGIGIEFATLADGRAIAGIDLDCCRNSETGQIEDWALAIIEEFNSLHGILATVRNRREDLLHIFPRNLPRACE